MFGTLRTVLVDFLKTGSGVLTVPSGTGTLATEQYVDDAIAGGGGGVFIGLSNSTPSSISSSLNVGPQ